MLKKTVFLGLFAALGLLAQGPGGPRPRGPEGRGPGFGGPREFENPVTGQPYSGTRTVVRQQALTDGTTITQQQQAQISRDSQGRVRMERTITTPGGQTRTQVTISDPVAGVCILWMWPIRFLTIRRCAGRRPMPTAEAGDAARALRLQPPPTPTSRMKASGSR